MYTRLTGRALNGSAVLLHPVGQSASWPPGSAPPRRPRPPSDDRRCAPSPAARSPACSRASGASTSADWRTLARSPAFDAVKIRCRNRRTLASARRQSIWRQPKRASSGPFTTTTMVGWRPTCPRVPGLRSSFSSTGSPDRVSTLSRPGTRPGIRPVIRDDRPGGADHHVPVSRCLSAAGIRFSVIRFPPRELGPPHGRLTGDQRRTSTGLPRSARTSYDRGGCPLYPEDGGAHPGRVGSPTGACRFPAASPCTPLPTSHRARLRFTRHQRGFKQFTRPVFPSPVAARMERAALGLSPELRTPPTRSRRRTSRRGQAIEHGPGTTRSTSHPSILQSCSSLTTSGRPSTLLCSAPLRTRTCPFPSIRLKQAP